MDASTVWQLAGAAGGGFVSGWLIGYRTGFVNANHSEKTKCHKIEGSRGSQVSVKILRWFFGKTVLCRLKKGDICRLDNTKCDFKP